MPARFRRMASPSPPNPLPMMRMRRVPCMETSVGDEGAELTMHAVRVRAPKRVDLVARCVENRDMKHRRLRFGQGFRVAFGNARAQAATMVIAPGKSEGGPGNRHRGADQWLFVVSGRGVLKRKRGRAVALRTGSLVLIEHGDEHEV